MEIIKFGLIIAILAIIGAVFYASTHESKYVNLDNCTIIRHKSGFVQSNNYHYTEHLTPEKCEQLKKELLK